MRSRAALIAGLALALLVRAESATARPPPGAAESQPRLRICCALGYDLALGFGARAAPVGVQNVVEASDLGQHRYHPRSLFDEKSGLVYTCRAGLIDIGHLRGAADMVAHLYARLGAVDGAGRLALDLADGALEVTLARPLSDAERLGVAQRVAYDLTVWHEIVTGSGDRTVPIFSEIFSALSPEDLYSDLVGTRLGAAAIASPLPYDAAMQALLSDFLARVQARPLATTRAALDQVEGRWWRAQVAVPRPELLAARNPAFAPPLLPWQVPSPEALGCEAPRALAVSWPELAGAAPLADLYDLTLTAPAGSKLGARAYRESDFETLVRQATNRLRTLEPRPAPPVARAGIRVLPFRGFGGARRSGEGPGPSGGVEVVGATSEGLGGDLSIIRFASAYQPGGQGLVHHFTGIQAEHLFFCTERGEGRVHPPLAAWFQSCEPRGFFGIGGTLAQVQHDGGTGRWALRPIEGHVSFSLLDDAFSADFLRRHLILSTGLSVETARRPQGPANFSVRANAQLRGHLASEDQLWQADLHLLLRQDVTDFEDLGAEAGLSLVRRFTHGAEPGRPPWGTTTLGVELAATRWTQPLAALDDHLLPLTPTDTQDSLRAVLTLGFSFGRWVF